MTTAALGSSIHGPAVIVDDKIEGSDQSLEAILGQLAAAEIPVVRLQSLPTLDAVVHWRRFGLIILDWQLTYGEAVDTTVPLGVPVPSGLAEDSREQVTAFVRELLESTALPVFIASNSNVDEIKSHLAAELADFGAVLDQRVKVYKKSELHESLLTELDTWLSHRPSLVALQSWSQAYLAAETAAFQAFMQAEEDWVAAVYRASVVDGSAFEQELRELLARNIVNRLGRLDISWQPPAAGEQLTDGGALRHVLHMGAVIPDAALDPREVGTGDLFVRADAVEPFDEIDIVVTPECDLLRGDELRITYLRAKCKPNATQSNSKKRVDAAGRPDRLHLITCLLTPRGDEYDISLKDWEVVAISSLTPVQALVGTDAAGGNNANEPASPTSPRDAPLWPKMRRIGRLMDPYITHVQQNYALATIRKGLAKIPDDFFAGWQA